MEGFLWHYNKDPVIISWLRQGSGKNSLVLLLWNDVDVSGWSLRCYWEHKRRSSTKSLQSSKNHYKKWVTFLFRVEIIQKRVLETVIVDREATEVLDIMYDPILVEFNELMKEQLMVLLHLS